MKRIFAILLAVLFTVILLSACGADHYPAPPMSSSNMAPGDYDYYAGDSDAVFFGSMPESMGNYESIEGSEFGYDGSAAVALSVSGGGGGASEKIIYAARAEIETLEFDDTVSKVYEMLGANNAFIESSNVSGINHEERQHGIRSFRSANFTLRVPWDRLASMTESLDRLGNVVYIESNARNITAEFIDTESHLIALRAQEESLINMLRAADSVADMIYIQERLSDVRYGIESLTSMLRNWQNQVDYSTLTLSIREVLLFTETEIVIEEEEELTYWQQIGDGFLNTAIGVGEFFAEFFRVLVISSPVLIVIGATVAIILIILKLTVWSKSSKARRKLKKSRNENRAAHPTQFAANHPGQFMGGHPNQFTGVHPGQFEAFPHEQIPDSHQVQFAENAPSQFAGSHPGQFADEQQNQFADGHPGQFADGYPEQFTDNHPGQFADNLPDQFAGNYPEQFADYQDEQYAVGHDDQIADSQTGQFTESQWVQSQEGHLDEAMYYENEPANGFAEMPDNMNGSKEDL